MLHEIIEKELPSPYQAIMLAGLVGGICAGFGGCVFSLMMVVDWRLAW